MTGIVSGSPVLLLIIACLASAVYSLGGAFLPVKGLRGLSRGPSGLMAFIALCAALFLAIPMTVIWGLVLAAILLVCHIVGLRRLGRQAHS
jgi:hypothetical protein